MFQVIVKNLHSQTACASAAGRSVSNQHFTRKAKSGFNINSRRAMDGQLEALVGCILQKYVSYCSD
jgi:hypothetical protein